jgi:hypothetical protein
MYTGDRPICTPSIEEYALLRNILHEILLNHIVITLISKIVASISQRMEI